jgi:protein-S-isoprenylcysteine O-methyltransferase Ste14
LPIAELTLPVALCLLSWVAVGIGMAVNRAKGSGPAARRDPRALAGLLVQALGFSLCFRAWRSPARTSAAAEAILSWLGVALAWASAWVVIRSVRVLGREWSLEARLLPGHRLVQQGPYRHVRHPIYAAMLGLLVGTGLNVTAWPALVLGVALYLMGTRLRTRVEERLLSERFGEEYTRYAAEVPGLLPRPFVSRASRRS